MNDVSGDLPDDPSEAPTTTGSTAAEPTASGDEAIQPPNDAAPSSTGRRNLAIAGAGLLVLALLIGFLVTRGDDPVAVDRTTTTTTASTTTSTIPSLPGGTFEIATAKAHLDTLVVAAAEPTDWATTPLAVRTETPELPPASQDQLPARDALPRIDYPVQGRYAVEGGWEFTNPGPYTEEPQPFTMAVTERRGPWVKVQVPVRPNGTEGWVALSDVDITTTTYRIEIDLGEHMLRLFDDTELVTETSVVIGAADTPTPTGRFFVTDDVPQSNPGGAYGPIALATDGYSEVMDEFSTGVPVVALHGTNRPELVGQSVSNGCVRLPNDVITMLAETVPLGTPVLIWP